MMTAKEAANFAGCSISTLKRYECFLCEQTALNALRYGCSVSWNKCNPKEKTYPPRAAKLETKR